MGYHRFTAASEAILFAIEGFPRDLLVGAFLEVDERRYGCAEIRRLYENAKYPLARHAESDYG
jgi:hypothetical protein